MIPPTFQIGDEVIITGPSCTGNKTHIGEKFKISEILKRADECQYSTYDLGWYPAGSLRLVEPELKIGDWVKTISGTIFRIGDIYPFVDGSASVWVSTDGGVQYPSHCLRKLTPEEIKQHTTVSGIHGKYANIDARLSAIEKRQDRQTEASDILAQRLTEQRRSLDLLAPSHAELLGDVESLAEKVGDIGKQQKEMWERHDINRERLDKAEYKISALEGEQPETCDGKQSSLLSQRDYILHRIADDMMRLLDENFITDSNMRAREHVWLGELEAVNERLDSTREA